MIKELTKGMPEEAQKDLRLVLDILKGTRANDYPFHFSAFDCILLHNYIHTLERYYEQTKETGPEAKRTA